MRTYSILVVDDEPENFTAIGKLLPTTTYQLQFANSGAEAMAKIDACDPDLVLLDVAMPEMDGLATYQAIKAKSRWKSLPIVMMTPSTGRAQLTECLNAGAKDFIRQPIDALELRARVHSILQSQKDYARLESMSRLQKHKIESLENDLSELSGDLTASFARALNLPLSSILDELAYSLEYADSFGKDQIIDILKSSHQSAQELETLLGEFWTYIKFLIAARQFTLDETCMSKGVIDRNLPVNSPLKASISEITDVNLAVSPHHYQWAIHKILDRIEPDRQVVIQGKIVNRMYHFAIESDRPFIDGAESSMGTHIIKKIIETYGGKFTCSQPQNNRAFVAMSFPLA
jgi:two-component system, sensor histidine kinase and response regulator